MRWRSALCIAAAALVGLAACTAEVPQYRHEPTATVYETYDLEAAALDPFRHGPVVITPKMLQGWPEVKLSFVAREAATVTVSKMRLSGRGAQASTSVEVEPNRELPLKEFGNHPGIHGASFRAEVPVGHGEAIDAMGVEGFVVDVTWEVAGVPGSAQTQCVLDVQHTTATIWPT
jgi:hypothetical protein